MEVECLVTSIFASFNGGKSVVLRSSLQQLSRSAQAFTVEPGAVEAANASLPGRQHRAGILDPTRARLLLLGGGDPVDPISACVGRDFRPQFSRLRGG